MRLAGKVALVMGASAGIGRATVLALACEGADVALNYLTWPDGGESAAEQIRERGRRAILCPGDVSDQAFVESMVARTVTDLGRLDILVTCAFHSDEDYFYRAEMAGIRRTVDVTLWGTFYALRAAANVMIQQGQGGCAVLVSSIHAQQAMPACAAYNMAKAAVDQLGRTAALELARHRIRVNILYPGWTDTPGERKYFSEETLRQPGSEMPLGRLARPEEIARGVLFLVDPDSEYVTGSTLAVDGGGALPWWSKRGEGEGTF
jgi:glucose 1-dehydrogenase